MNTITVSATIIVGLIITIAIMAFKIQNLYLELGIKETETHYLSQAIEDQNDIVENLKIDIESYKKRVNSFRKQISDKYVIPKDKDELEKIEHYIEVFNGKVTTAN